MEGRIKCNMIALQLYVTLNCGQCYRWKCQSNGSWIGVFRHCVWIIKHENDYLFYKVNGNLKTLVDDVIKNKDILNIYCKTLNISDQNNLTDEDFISCAIWDYFRLFENLEDHYKRWSLCDSNFRQKADTFYGLRMLKQDSEEILFTFICSSNTTISRITTMVERLCLLYGDKICEIDGIPYYDFPDVTKLADPSVVQDLKEAKFGYRAEYIKDSASKIIEMGGKGWFKRLNSMSYQDAKSEMIQLPGIGEKVADCICLMGLDHLDAIPVDTHVFQISKQYIPELKNKTSVNTTTYKQIGNHFRSLFGHHAGWVHVVLFCADLKMHRPSKEAFKVTKKGKQQVSKVVVSKYFNNKNTKSLNSSLCTD